MLGSQTSLNIQLLNHDSNLEKPRHQPVSVKYSARFVLPSWELEGGRAMKWRFRLLSGFADVIQTGNAVVGQKAACTLTAEQHT